MWETARESWIYPLTFCSTCQSTFKVPEWQLNWIFLKKIYFDHLSYQAEEWSLLNKEAVTLQQQRAKGCKRLTLSISKYDWLIGWMFYGMLGSEKMKSLFPPAQQNWQAVENGKQSKGNFRGNLGRRIRQRLAIWVAMQASAHECGVHKLAKQLALTIAQKNMNAI